MFQGYPFAFKSIKTSQPYSFYWQFYCKSLLIHLVNTIILSTYGGVVGAVSKISAYRLQSPRFEPWLCRHLNICVTFFTEAELPFHPSGVGKQYQHLLGPNLRWISVPSRGSQILKHLILLYKYRRQMPTPCFTRLVNYLASS